ncbi:MAG: aldose epimerase family protein [Roseobacter sp.]
MIEISSKNLRARILQQGATLSGLWFEGQPNSLVLGSDDKKSYETELLYYGAIVGPVANRVAGATILLDGQAFPMDANDGQNCLHSGSNGLHIQNWTIRSQAKNSVVLQCHLKHGEVGLPGNRVFEIEYALSDNAVLSLKLTAHSDVTTPVNLAHHPYWSLDGSETIKNHDLQVFADRYLPIDKNTLPTGQITDVAGSPYDFRTFRKIPIDQTLDANLCLASAVRATPQPAAVLTAKGAPRLQIDTTEPGLQVYNGTGLSPTKTKLHDGQHPIACAGIALEPQRWPDAHSHPAFPSILLKAGTVYSQTTQYRISS